MVRTLRPVGEPSTSTTTTFSIPKMASMCCVQAYPQKLRTLVRNIDVPQQGSRSSHCTRRTGHAGFQGPHRFVEVCEQILVSYGESLGLRFEDSPAHDERDVAAKQARVGMQLVDDDELEVAEEPAPGVFAGEDREVEDVWVGEDLVKGRELAEQSGVRKLTDDVRVVPNVVSILFRRISIERCDLQIYSIRIKPSTKARAHLDILHPLANE